MCDGGRRLRFSTCLALPSVRCEQLYHTILHYCLRKCALFFYVCLQEANCTEQAPICFSAALYLALAAILRHTNSPRDYSPISPRALVTGSSLTYSSLGFADTHPHTVFVIADVLTIGAQVAGASLTGISESKNARGEHPPIAPDDANHILLAGLAIQVSLIVLWFLPHTAC